jgi:hypothetical protein
LHFVKSKGLKAVFFSLDRAQGLKAGAFQSYGWVNCIQRVQPRQAQREQPLGVAVQDAFESKGLKPVSQGLKPGAFNLWVNLYSAPPRWATPRASPAPRRSGFKLNLKANFETSFSLHRLQG